MIKKTLAAVAVAAFAALGTVVATPTPANAALSNCGSGYTCIWRDANLTTGSGGGAKYVRLAAYIPNLGQWSYSGTSINANDSASSLYNHGNYDRVYFYDGTSKAGYVGWNDKNTYWNNLSSARRGTNMTWNDAISSIYFASFV
jgi:hypothetical protein